MYIGLSNGKINYYKKRNMDSRSLLAPGKAHELVEMESKQGHKVINTPNISLFALILTELTLLIG